MKISVTSHHIYYRIFGYITTIIMHLVNIWCMTRRFQGDHKDSTIRFFLGNQMIFFTGWTFILQIVYAVAGLMCDLLTLKNANNNDYKLNKHLRGFRDVLFAGIQWPSSLIVSTLFWSIYNYDRDLIMPPVLDQVLTLPSNHVIHTAIVPVVIWELVFRPRRVPRSHKRNLGHLAFHMLVYLSVIIYTYNKSGSWPYPIFTRLYGTIYFPVFLLIVGVILLFYYYIQWPLTRLIWGDLDSKKME